uniref:Uncharacterized protein n=1 Tax=Ditylenchus dipsaci TaxID=166011 RepID=A0A915EUI8_9BILA
MRPEATRIAEEKAGSEQHEAKKPFRRPLIISNRTSKQSSITAYLAIPQESLLQSWEYHLGRLGGSSQRFGLVSMQEKRRGQSGLMSRRRNDENGLRH